MKAPHYNYMKYYRVIRRYYCQMHKIDQNDLDMLFFIHDEKYFSLNRFKEFNRLLTWDFKRLKRLVADGWINYTPGLTKYAEKNVYEASMKTQRVITNVYKALNGDIFPNEKKAFNRSRKRYWDRKYQDYLGGMIEEIKENKKKMAEQKAEEERARLRDERIRRARGQ